MTRLSSNVLAVRVVGLESVVSALIAAGDEDWIEGMQQEWLTYVATPAVLRSTPVRTGNLKASTSDKVDDSGKGRYAGIVQQDARTGVRNRKRKNTGTAYQGRIPYAQFVEMKPQRQRYMLNAAQNLMPQYRRWLTFKLSRRLTFLGIGR